MGGTIMGPLGASVGGDDIVMTDRDAMIRPSLPVGLQHWDLPSGFAQRIRSVSTNTMLHVRASYCLHMHCVVTQCWHCMAHGRDDHAQLEEGRSKLLLSPVPLVCGV